jgi:hypothetical protein
MFASLIALGLVLIATTPFRMASTTKTSGIIKDIRSCIESDQYDLGGFDAPQALGLMKGAFEDALPTTDMLRITFVVGGTFPCCHSRALLLLPLLPPLPRYIYPSLPFFSF